jgi:DNA-directed RNA polymerase specialized sigma24 family protein
MHGDRQLAEDIVQETLLRAWTHADRLPADAQRPWLLTTAPPGHRRLPGPQRPPG